MFRWRQAISAAGNAGNDLMSGGAGDETPDGGLGDDLIFANRGNDTTQRRARNDLLFALARRDVSGPGDVNGHIVRGEAGDDRIRVRDGEQDTVSCGEGNGMRPTAPTRVPTTARRSPRRTAGRASGSR